MDVEFQDKDKSIQDGVRNVFTDANANELKNAVNSKQDKLSYTPVPDTRTVNGKPLTENVTITKGEIGLANAIVFCGTWNLSGNSLPNVGGTGSGGSIEKGNEFFSPTASTSLLGRDGGIIPANVLLRAMINNPGQDISNWLVIYTQA
jgi:hypothetical protein